MRSVPFVPSDTSLVIPKPAEPLDEPLVKVTSPALSTDQSFCFTPFDYLYLIFRPDTDLKSLPAKIIFLLLKSPFLKLRLHSP